MPQKYYIISIWAHHGADMLPRSLLLNSKKKKKSLLNTQQTLVPHMLTLFMTAHIQTARHKIAAPKAVFSRLLDVDL